MDRRALIGAFEGTTPTSQACLVALTEGADFEVWDEATAIPDLIKIYSRRAEHVAAIGLGHGEFDRGLRDLKVYTADAVTLGQVTDSAGQRHYQVFLAPHADEVVACLWVRHEP